MWAIGVSTWVWASPLTDDVLAGLAPRIREWGFDLIELPVEHPGDWDPHRAAELPATLDLKASVCLAMAPGRNLVEADTVAETQDYLRHVVDDATIATAASIWRPLASSPDALATGGLTFLRDAAAPFSG